MKIKNVLKIVALMSLIISGSPKPGMSTTVTTSYLSGVYGYDSGSIEPGPNGSNSYTNSVGFGGDLQKLVTASGPVSFATVGNTFVTWCVDIYHWDAANSTYTVGTASDLAAATDGGNPAFGTTRVNTLIELADEDYSLVKNQNTSAAFQLAVWSIMFGTPNNSGIYNVDSATFKAIDNTGGSTAIATADTWLANINSASLTGNYQLTYLYDPGCATQNMAVFTPAPVPEPSTMMLLGAGIAGIAFLKKRKSA